MILQLFVIELTECCHELLKETDTVTPPWRLANKILELPLVQSVQFSNEAKSSCRFLNLLDLPQYTVDFTATHSAA